MVKRIIQLVLAMVVCIGCGGNIENYYYTTNVYTSPDAAAVEMDSGAAGSIDQYVPSGLEGSTEGSVVDSDTAILPKLIFAFEGPPAQTVLMGDSMVKPFCFSLEAQGTTFDAWLPTMHIDSMDGGLVVTNSLSGVVFEGVSIMEGMTVVIESSKMSPSLDDTKGFYPYLQYYRIRVLKGTTRHLCVVAAIVDFSLTPENFFGKSYQLVMEDWTYTTVFDFYGAEAPVPRNRIIAPSKVVGNPLTISASGGVPPVKYTGMILASPSTTQPVASIVTPGQLDVPMMSFDLTASSGGACVRGIDVTRHGVGSMYDLGCVGLYDGSMSIFNACKSINDPVSEKWTFGWHDHGLLFCLEGGRTRRFTVHVSFSVNAIPGDVHVLGIDDPAKDVDIVTGTASGPAIVGSTFNVGFLSL